MEEKKDYQKALEAQLKEWEIELERLNVMAQKAKIEVKLEYQKQIDDLMQKRNEVQLKLYALKDSADEAWKEIKAGAEVAMEDLSKAFKNAMAKFK